MLGILAEHVKDNDSASLRVTVRLLILTSGGARTDRFTDRELFSPFESNLYMHEMIPKIKNNAVL